ncbi:hypothetical protein AAC387_Pa01g1600 [Persea americana]
MTYGFGALSVYDSGQKDKKSIHCEARAIARTKNASATSRFAFLFVSVSVSALGSINGAKPFLLGTDYTCERFPRICTGHVYGEGRSVTGGIRRAHSTPWVIGSVGPTKLKSPHICDTESVDCFKPFITFHWRWYLCNTSTTSPMQMHCLSN